MIDKIVLSRDRTRATIYFTNRSNFGVYSDIGQVELLVLDLIGPIGSNSISSNYDSVIDYIDSQYSDTIIIDINELNKAS